MGCNAWNHAPDCDCGWGGDTGASPYRHSRAIDGLDWRTDRKPRYATFMNPNALCPVCGACVYFYRAPSGGRVFFDELGPPWPKHWCTDHQRSSVPQHRWHDEPVLAPTAPEKAKPLPMSPYDWRPLLAEEIAGVGKFDRVRVPKWEHLPSKYLYVASDWVRDAPAFWRWSPSDPTMVEVSCVRVDQNGALRTETFAVPNWLNDDEALRIWLTKPSTPPTAEQVNSIGWCLSFSARTHADGWWLRSRTVDTDVARSCFEQAAKQGHIPAINNLGVMYRDGIGVAVDPVRAFECFQVAAQALDIVPVRHLARCYREGIGCDPDPSYGTFLEELISVLESEWDSMGAENVMSLNIDNPIDDRLKTTWQMLQHAYSKPVAERVAFVRVTLMPMIPHFKCGLTRAALTKSARRILDEGHPKMA